MLGDMYFPYDVIELANKVETSRWKKIEKRDYQDETYYTEIVENVKYKSELFFSVQKHMDLFIYRLSLEHDGFEVVDATGTERELVELYRRLRKDDSKLNSSIKRIFSGLEKVLEC